jgi:hypothetical protein
MRTGDPAPLLSAAASGCAELPLRTLGTEQVHGERGAFGGVDRSDGQQCPPAAHFTLADPTALRTSKRPGHVCPVLFDRNRPAPRCPKNLGAPTPQLGARAEDSPAPAACNLNRGGRRSLPESPRDLRRSEGQPGTGGGPDPWKGFWPAPAPSWSQETDAFVGLAVRHPPQAVTKTTTARMTVDPRKPGVTSASPPQDGRSLFPLVRPRDWGRGQGSPRETLRPAHRPQIQSRARATDSTTTAMLSITPIATQ